MIPGIRPQIVGLVVSLLFATVLGSSQADFLVS